MTKQEAIHELSTIFGFGFYNERVDQALNMAIKALEQEPSCRNIRQVDLISRQAAIEAICVDGTMLERQGQYSMTMVERKQRDTDIIEALPSVVPSRATDKWVPVSEKLPEDFRLVLICFKWGDMEVADYDSKSKCWDTLDAHVDEDKVLAWMPLPKPYKESEEE